MYRTTLYTYKKKEGESAPPRFYSTMMMDGYKIPKMGEVFKPNLMMIANDLISYDPIFGRYVEETFIKIPK